MRIPEWLGCQMTVALPGEQQPGLLQNRLRDGRMRLPVGAWLATTRCQASGTMNRCKETHPCSELAESLMVKQSEPTINLVTCPRRNALIRLAKRQASRRWYFGFTISPFVVSPGNSGYLTETLNVDYPEHGKPVHPQTKTRGMPFVRRADGWAGRRTKRKQRTPCNEAYRVD